MTTGIAAKTPIHTASLKGVVKVDVRLVAMRLEPFGRSARIGRDTNEKISFAKIMQGTVAIATANTAFSNRSRSSRRCEISVPSFRSSWASGSGSLMAAGGGSRGWRGLYGRRGRGRLRGRDGCCRLGRRRRLAVIEAEVLGGHFLIELVAELSRHGARPSHPAADVLGELRQFLGTEDQQCDERDQQDLGEADVEHRDRDAGYLAAVLPAPVVVLFSPSNSASPSMCFSCFADSSVSPSFIAFLKPLTAEPRSEPSDFNFLPPKMSRAMTRMISNSLNPMGPMTRSS